MKRTLVNGLGQPFSSKTITNSNTDEQIFLYKHNFKKIDNAIVANEIKVYKRNAEQSKAAKANYKMWSKSVLKLRRIYLGELHSIETKLVRKGILTVGINGETPTKDVSNKEVVKKLAKFEKIKDTTIAKVSLLGNEASEKMLLKTKAQTKEEKVQLSEDAASKVAEIKEIITKFSELAKGFKKSFEDLAKVDLTKTTNTKNEAIMISKGLSKVLRENRSNISEKSSAKINEYKDVKNLSLFDKFNLNISLNSRRLYKNEVIANELRGKEENSYDLTYKFKKANIYVEYEKSLIDIKLAGAKQINTYAESLKEAKKLGDKNKEQLKDIKKNISIARKEALAAKKIEMKAGSASKRAKQVEKKRINNQFSVELREKRIANDKIFHIKNEIKGFRNKIKNDIKLQTKIRENALKDALIQTPVETSKTSFWFGIILGTIFPGLGTLFTRKYTKAIIQIIATSFAVLVLAWIFGAFPSHIGNGLMGLGSLGSDPATASSISIGTTAGEANDGRFYLVIGAMALILLAVIIMYWIISILDNINQNNAARLGMRPSNWKDQRKMLKSQGLPYLLSLPAMIFIVFIVLLPLIATVFIAFTDFGQKNWDPVNKGWIIANGITSKISWVGGEQFRLIFVVMGPELKSVLIWTLIWTFGATFTLLIIGTFFALVVNQPRIRFKTLFRVIYILPWAVPAFITILYFSIFFNHSGPFNSLFGIDTDWAQAGSKTKILMIFMQGWLGHSYIFLLVTGMLQSIPKSLYEASRIDGASSWKQFTSITMPIIMSKIAPLIIGQFVFNFNNFGLIYLFNGGGIVETAGGTAGAQDIFISWIYKLVNGASARPGAAAAMSLFISVFTVTPSAFMFVRSKAFKGDI